MSLSFSKKIFAPLLAMLLVLPACEHAEDPFVDREAAPVLVVIDNAKQDYLAGGGLYTEPVAEIKISEPVLMAASFYELDKSGILDHTVGIDSLPVVNLAVTLLKRDGTKIADLTTDGSGKISLSKSWEELGVTAPKSGSTISLLWSGQYKGKPFTRYSKVQGVN